MAAAVLLALVLVLGAAATAAAASAVVFDTSPAAAAGLAAAQQNAGRASSLAACLAGINGAPETRLPGSQNWRDYANGLRIIRWHWPAAVIFPRTIPQVQAAVLCARKFGTRPIPRGGGNSFEALSTGDGALVIDLSELAATTVDVAANVANVSGGARMGNVYADVADAGRAAGRNLTTLGGVWPQVGFGGLLAAGGYGSLSRAYGVLADHVVAARVVDAQGRLLTANSQANPGLFFAIRGGGGGTYGIVVEATVKLIEVPHVTLGRLLYDGHDHTVELLDRFQRWGPVAPRELTFTYNLVRAGSNFKFVYLGRPDGLRAALDQGGLAALPGAQLEMVECDALSFRGWLAGLDRCRADNVRVPQRVTPGGLLIRDREASRYRSALFAEPIPRAGLEEIRALVSDKDGKFWKLFQWKVYGGAFDEVSPSFNAFPHRKGARMHTEFGSSFGYQRSADEVPRAEAQAIWDWLGRATATLDKYATSARYNGYVSFLDDVAAYFGQNYARLRAVEAAYDPETFSPTEWPSRRRRAPRAAAAAPSRTNKRTSAWWGARESIDDVVWLESWMLFG